MTLFTASHATVKSSKRLRSKYLSIVRRVGRNRAIVAIARILAEIVYFMLKNGVEFIGKIDSLTERKMKAMSINAKNAMAAVNLRPSVKPLRERMLTKTS